MITCVQSPQQIEVYLTVGGSASCVLSSADFFLFKNHIFQKLLLVIPFDCKKSSDSDWTSSRSKLFATVISTSKQSYSRRGFLKVEFGWSDMYTLSQCLHMPMSFKNLAMSVNLRP